MPLSDHEQKMLEQMEHALAAEDPKFASQMQGSTLASVQRRRWVIGGIGVVAGLGLVLVGVNTTMWVGAIGFAVMVAAAVFAATPPRRAQLGVVRPDGTAGPAPKGAARRKGGQKSFMDKLDERWERRQNNW
ncbi:DUF3040 domain-containing protein [Oryzobacter telluris]|uniref:DUF3040 domain-containing protein n=1 Tax=Oryzobacter telluris TaxID=3149179 RepID=UPI00370D5F07